MRADGARINKDWIEPGDKDPRRRGRGACWTRVEAVMRSCCGVASLAWAAGWSGAHR